MSRSALYSPRKQTGVGLLGAVVLSAGVVVAGFLLATAVKDFRKYDQFIEVRAILSEPTRHDKQIGNLTRVFACPKPPLQRDVTSISFKALAVAHD